MLLNAGLIASSAVDEGGLDLFTNLLAWWKFNNNLNDESANGITLSLLGGGTASYVAGDIDNAIDITADTIPSATNAALDSLHTSGFQFAVVFNPDSYGSTFTTLLAHFDNGNSSNRKFALKFDDVTTSPGTTRRLFLAAYDSPGSLVAIAEIIGLPATGSYHLIEGYFDPSIGTHGRVGVAVDNGAFATADLTAAMGTVSTTTTPLTIGNEIETGGGGTDDLRVGRNVDGKIEMVAIWSAPFADLSPTGTERAALWNSGNFRVNP